MSRASIGRSSARSPNRSARRHRQQCRRHPLRIRSGPDRGGLGPHPPGRRRGVFFLPARRPRDDRAARGGRRRGRVINMASVSGRGYAGASNAAYAAGEGAVIWPTRWRRSNLDGTTLNLNWICPGVTRTELRAQRGHPRRGARRLGRADAGRARGADPDPAGRRRTTSRRWRCSWPRPAPATLPASPTMSTMAWSQLTKARSEPQEPHLQSSPPGLSRGSTGCPGQARA